MFAVPVKNPQLSRRGIVVHNRVGAEQLIGNLVPIVVGDRIALKFREHRHHGRNGVGIIGSFLSRLEGKDFIARSVHHPHLNPQVVFYVGLDGLHVLACIQHDFHGIIAIVGQNAVRRQIGAAFYGDLLFVVPPGILQRERHIVAVSNIGSGPVDHREQPRVKAKIQRLPDGRARLHILAHRKAQHRASVCVDIRPVEMDLVQRPWLRCGYVAVARAAGKRPHIVLCRVRAFLPIGRLYGCEYVCRNNTQ